jgi:hypothetical protein
VRIDGFSEDGSDLFEVVVLESSSDVQQIEREPFLLAYIERPSSSTDRVSEKGGILATTSTVERDSDHVDIELLRLAEKTAYFRKRSTELETQSTEGGRVVGEDSENHLGRGVVLLDLDEFVTVVERHTIDVVLGGVTNERGGLAGVRVDDSGGRNLSREVQNGCDFGLRRAVESEPECRHKSKNVWVRVRLDS